MTTLNKAQEAAVAAVTAGRNIFLTGAGGTGKSHTIKAIVAASAAKGIPVALTAMTGCAALLLNTEGSATKAKTLHSWAGVGLARDPPHVLVAAIQKNRKALKRWTGTQLLIVDEVSMMIAEFLETLDLVARTVRKRPDTKFGGLQIVFAGDFCQLPPIRDSSSTSLKYVFESPIWASLLDETHYLTEIVRQRDPVFQRLLTEARMGALTPESIALLQARKGIKWQDQEIKPTLLFTKNAEVDKINRINMEALTGERRTFIAQTVQMERSGPRIFNGSGHADIQAALAKLDTDAPYDPSLELCVGAQVMLLTNMDQERGLVNGSRGILTGYSGGGLPLVRFIGFTDPVIVDRANWWLADPDHVGRSQIPLKIAYALTIHKSQGATLDSALIDIGSSTFEYGQAYVALSRVRSLEGLYVWALDPKRIVCHPVVRRFYESLAE
jgi:ATP-dependent DNA helicase PIF1